MPVYTQFRWTVISRKKDVQKSLEFTGQVQNGIIMIGTFLAVLFPKNNGLIRSLEFGMMWNPYYGMVYCFVKTIYLYQFYTPGEGKIDPWGYECGYFVQLVGFAL